MKIKRSIGILLAAAALSGCVKEDATPVSEVVAVGDHVPEFSVTGYSSAQTAGKITLIVFFDPACGDCRRERPLLEYVWENLRDVPDFEMANFARDRTLESLAEAPGGDLWLATPCYPDPDREIYNLFATSTIPRIYLIDREGIVRETWAGDTGLSARPQEFLAIVRRYLETP